MECFIENTLLLADIDNLNYMMIIESDNGGSEKEGVITKIVNKIKEIWQKIKNFFTSKKMDKDIKTLKSMEPQAAKIEAHMKKEDPEKLEETQEKISKKLVYEGAHIKDWLSAFKEFFKHNYACIKKGQLHDCKPLNSFLNKKQKTVRNATIGLGIAISTIVNLCLEFKGISIQGIGDAAAEELERRADLKIQRKYINKGIKDTEREYIKKASQNKDLSKEEKQSQIENIKNKSKKAQKVTDAAYKKAVEHGGATKEIEELNKASLILRDGIAKFNTIGSILASLIGSVINTFRGSKKMDEAILTDLPIALFNLPPSRNAADALKGLSRIKFKGQSYRKGKEGAEIDLEG